MPNTKKVTVDQLNTVAQAIATKSDDRFQQQEEGKGLSTNDYTTTEKNKLNGIEQNANNYTLPDATGSAKGGVIVGSNIDVSGGTISVADASTSDKGVVQLSSATDSTDATKAATPAAVKAAYDLANGKQSPQTTLNGYGIQDAYTKTEVDNKIAAAASSSYHAGGSLAPAGVVAALLVAANDSKVYNLSGELTLDATTAALFVDGATGDVIHAGDNIVVVNNGTAEAPSYKFDKMAGFIDLSGYATTADVEAASAQDIQAIVDGIYAD